MKTTHIERAWARERTPKRLPYVFDWSPPSSSIAATLNDCNASVCEHGRCPCFVFCGVERDPVAGWRPIDEARRAEWFGRIQGCLVRLYEWDKTR